MTFFFFKTMFYSEKFLYFSEKHIKRQLEAFNCPDAQKMNVDSLTSLRLFILAVSQQEIKMVKI